MMIIRPKWGKKHRKKGKPQPRQFFSKSKGGLFGPSRYIPSVHY